jgi:hypothetical protein
MGNHLALLRSLHQKKQRAQRHHAVCEGQIPARITCQGVCNPPN